MNLGFVEQVSAHSFAIDLYSDIVPKSTESLALGFTRRYWASMYNYDEYTSGMPIAEGEGDTPDEAMANLFHNVQRTLTFSSIDEEVGS